MSTTRSIVGELARPRSGQGFKVFARTVLPDFNSPSNSASNGSGSSATNTMVVQTGMRKVLAAAITVLRSTTSADTILTSAGASDSFNQGVVVAQLVDAVGGDTKDGGLFLNNNDGTNIAGTAGWEGEGGKIFFQEVAVITSSASHIRIITIGSGNSAARERVSVIAIGI